MLLMLCDQCAIERGLATCDEVGRYTARDVVAGVRVGCFPDLYAALAANPPDHVITLQLCIWQLDCGTGRLILFCLTLSTRPVEHAAPSLWHNGGAAMLCCACGRQRYGLMDDNEHVRLEYRALWRARELGHSISGIEWDAAKLEGIGTCTRCGDGVLLYWDLDDSSIHGTAYEAECPGDTCAYGWQVIALPEGGVLLRCLHCGAERTESAHGDAQT